jgi:hypothetical protein
VYEVKEYFAEFGATRPKESWKRRGVMGVNREILDSPLRAEQGVNYTERTEFFFSMNSFCHGAKPYFKAIL